MTENTATAADLIETLKTASVEEATAILNGEQEREEDAQRVTVIRAAQDRLEELSKPGETLDTDPEAAGAWAQLLDASGTPVMEGGQPVKVDIIG